ncbi:Uu.00g105690.m01.CDS01 [Anthostomella pinea]|uniref:Uu.00g105690.m01.CDS01 n=1 Tax=Anthostomella pinea TaxID=933095 RepID=A0AAI8VE28_9PEZI|nr:Uu.00g105690.m01.CDS01 [Anthostomella pinea]
MATEPFPQNGNDGLAGAGHAEEDFERVVHNMRKAAFDEWPNEAGFEGLTEVRGPVGLKVKGSIPAWAAGTLYRTGPGQYNVEDTPKGTFRTTHWFDGFGHSHKFEITADPHSTENPIRVEYTSRRQTQDYVAAIKKTGRLPDVSFGQRQDPCVGIFAKVMSVWRQGPRIERTPTSQNVCVVVNANVPGVAPQSTVAQSSGHRSGSKSLYLTTDARIMKEISADTLEPVGMATQQALDPLLKGPLSCAHAQRDPETGDFFNYNLDLSLYATYRIFRTNASSGTTDILATISQGDIKPAYIHSMFLSPSFVILCVPSTHLGMLGIKVPWNGCITDALEPFDESKRRRWFIVDRLGDRGVVAAYDSPAGFHFHSINSFEEHDDSTGDTNIFCDVVEYPTLDIIRAFEMDVLLNRDGATEKFWRDGNRAEDGLPRLARHKFRVPAKGSQETAQGTAEKVFEIKSPHVGELPTINPAYATKKYRYCYSLPTRGYSTLLDTIVKTDVETRQTLFWDNPKGHSPGEAIFVSRPRTAEDGEKELDEDDGVLMSVVLDGFGKTSYLLCLDAKTMKELGRAECEWAVALGFHGLHAPSDVPPHP